MSHASETTPCVNICKINTEHGICGGCKRTQDEIKQWRSYSDEMREAVLKDLEEREEI